MILAELVRRRRGGRMLVVTPRHVLGQIQRKLSTRFSLPSVLLDALGEQDGDAVVIDESHNVTYSRLQNNRLARRAEALILAFATPHNRRADSFAELIRMLEPSGVGADWAGRMPPHDLRMPASSADNEIAAALDEVWLHPTDDGVSPVHGNNRRSDGASLWENQSPPLGAMRTWHPFGADLDVDDHHIDLPEKAGTKLLARRVVLTPGAKCGLRQVRWSATSVVNPSRKVHLSPDRLGNCPPRVAERRIRDGGGIRVTHAVTYPWTGRPAEASVTGGPELRSGSDIHAHGRHPTRGRFELSRGERGQCANV